MKPLMLMDEKDAANAKALAEIFRTAPCNIADAFGIQPAFVERLMARRGQYALDGGESLIDAVRKWYGDKAARLCLE